MNEQECKDFCRKVMDEQYKEDILRFQTEIEVLKLFNKKLKEQIDSLMSNNKSSIETGMVLINRIEMATECIKDFLCTTEYITLNSDAIARNYMQLLNILEKGERYDKKD